MERSVEGPEDRALAELLEREDVLQRKADEEDLKYSGLKDIDTLLELIALKFEISNRLLDRFDPAAETPDDRPSAKLIRDRAAEAVGMLDELRKSNISEDQKNLLTEAGGYQRVRETFQEFILRGGGAFLDVVAEDSRKLKIIARALADSIRKYTAADDRYRQVFKTENLPKLLRDLVNFFLPVLAPEQQQDPPYGLEEGEERLLSAEKMKMPLSQAIHYLETEVVPQLERELDSEPGNARTQRQLRLVREKLREYKNITFKPRATPINLEKGFYTDWLSQYTADGELLVTVALPVSFKSGTNLDRMRELVQTEMVRRLAGKGVCPALDDDYRFRKSLESGRRGSSRLPSFKLDVRRGFRELKSLYPTLMLLEDRKEFQKLVDLVGSSGKRSAQKAIESMIEGSARDLLQLP